MTADHQPGDSWQTTSGLPLADADAEITDLVFGINPNIGALCANMTFRLLESGEEAEQSFSVGDHWDPVDKGARAQKNGGVGRQQFSKQSNFGRLIESVVALDAGRQALASRGEATEAATWIGTRWHVGTVKVTSRNPSTGEEKERDAFVFTDYLGVGDGTTPAAPTNQTASSPASNGEIAGPLKAKLLKLAKNADDHDAFMAEALDLPEVTDSDDAMAAVVDSGPGSIWAVAHG